MIGLGNRKLSNNWKPLPPRPNGKKVNVHEKDTIEQTTSLIQAVWEIFEN